jgi:hypothetical protein
MPVAITASVLGLLVVLIAFYRDAPLEERRVVAPNWGLLPDPAEVARTEFPLSFPGYDPATVEFHFDTLTRAYGDLLAVAPADVVAKARRRAALRGGIELTEEQPPAPGVWPAPPTSLTPLVEESADVEALRAEVALAELEHRGPSTPDPSR